MARRKRMYAWLLCAAIALVLFVSSAYAVQEAGHICHGDGCLICEAVRQAEAMAQSFLLPVGPPLLAFIFLAFIQAFRIAACLRSFTPRTLIGWKIRLNN